MEEIKIVNIAELRNFSTHPYIVELNHELIELAQSIKREGILVPLLVRKNPYGEGYEIIAGH